MFECIFFIFQGNQNVDADKWALIIRKRNSKSWLKKQALLVLAASVSCFRAIKQTIICQELHPEVSFFSFFSVLIYATTFLSLEHWVKCFLSLYATTFPSSLVWDEAVMTWDIPFVFRCGKWRDCVQMVVSCSWQACSVFSATYTVSLPRAHISKT